MRGKDAETEPSNKKQNYERDGNKTIKDTDKELSKPLDYRGRDLCTPVLRPTLGLSTSSLLGGSVTAIAGESEL